MDKLEKRKEEAKEYRKLVDKCLALMDKYVGVTFGIPVWGRSWLSYTRV